MTVFGLISSIFDLATFALLLFVLNASASQFQTGWFIESLATATLIVLVVRTRRVPFFLSRPSKVLTFSVVGTVSIGILVTYLPTAEWFGFEQLPLGFFLALVAVIVGYLILIEVAKRAFLASQSQQRPSQYKRDRGHRLQRRSVRFSSHKKSK